ncbi:MAG: hypothetical protein M0Z58_07105 [Nitrospiraceae bacterium]|nr:hypothetical protein [Nitrospiraceae bacterium]
MFLKKLPAAFFIVFLGSVVCLGSVRAFAIESFPGSTWGELLWQVPAEGPQPNIPDLVSQGWIRQGADVAQWGGAHLVPYLTIRYAVDTRGLSWNNTIGPGVGLSVLTVPMKQSSVTFGVENIWDYYDRDWGYSASRLTDTVNVYMDWYGWWDLKK